MLFYTGYLIYRFEKYRQTQVFDLKREMILYAAMLYVIAAIKLAMIYHNPVTTSYFIVGISSFIPIGLMIPIIQKSLNDFPKVMIISSMMAIGIQIFIVFNQECAPLTSLLLNLIGACVGFSIYKIFCFLFKREENLEASNTANFLR